MCRILAAESSSGVTFPSAVLFMSVYELISYQELEIKLGVKCKEIVKRRIGLHVGWENDQILLA